CVSCAYDRATAAAEYRTVTTSRAEVERLVRGSRPAVLVIEACASAGWVHVLARRGRSDTPSGHSNPSRPSGSATLATAQEPGHVVAGKAQRPEHEERPDRAQQVIRDVARAEDPDHHTDDRALPNPGHEAVEEPRSRWFAAGRRGGCAWGARPLSVGRGALGGEGP